MRSHNQQPVFGSGVDILLIFSCATLSTADPLSQQPKNERPNTHAFALSLDPNVGPQTRWNLVKQIPFATVSVRAKLLRVPPLHIVTTPLGFFALISAKTSSHVSPCASTWKKPKLLTYPAVNL